MISKTLYLTVNGTSKSELAGGLSAGEKSSYITRPGEYRKDLQTLDELIQNIQHSAISRHEWISSLKLDDDDLVRNTVVGMLKANSDEEMVAKNLSNLAFFSCADFESLCAFVKNINGSIGAKENFAAELSVGVPTPLLGDALVALENGDFEFAAIGMKYHADMGNQIAQYNYALMSKSGKGMDVNLADAAKYFELAADQGNKDAQLELGVAFHSGSGAPQDFQLAMKWYQRAADQNVCDAHFNIGLLLIWGEGVEQDTHEAIRRFQLSAAQGNTQAMFNIGAAYDHAMGIEQDRVAAAKWYLQAAENGHVEAQYSLGQMYASGEGVPKDIAISMKWFGLAARNGHEKAMMKIFSPQFLKT